MIVKLVKFFRGRCFPNHRQGAYAVPWTPGVGSAVFTTSTSPLYCPVMKTPLRCRLEMASKTVIEEDGAIKDFRDWIKADGSTEFQSASGRYHLYGQHLCPYSSRVTIGIILKGLQNVISCDNLDYVLPEGPGWKFSPEKEGCDADSVNGYTLLREAYDASAKKLGASGYAGRVTVPTLYDKKLGRIVSNDSASILRMLNSEFNEHCASPEQKELDLYPSALQPSIEEVEEWTRAITMGIYGPAFAKTQEDYDAAIEKLYNGLDKAEELLAKNRYLLGKQLTEADIRLFVVLVRFDSVYALLKCSKKRIADYPALWGYTRDIYQTGNVRDAVVFEQIMKGSFLSKHTAAINPFKIVPALASLDFNAPHNRENM